jgi:hypothetical protein
LLYGTSMNRARCWRRNQGLHRCDERCTTRESARICYIF